MSSISPLGFDTSFRITCNARAHIHILRNFENASLMGLFGFFDADIFFHHGLHSLPKGYHKQKSKESDNARIMTSQAVLVEILKKLKDAFWPFQHDQSGICS